MSYFVKISPQPDGFCLGYAVIKIDAVPRNISEQTAARILNTCEAGNISCEVCFSTAGAENTTEIFIILRGSRQSGQELYEDIKRYMQIILDELSSAAFRAHAVSEDAELAPVCKFFNGELSMQSRGCYFYPADEIHDGFYIPGSYSDIRGRLDLKSMLEVLNNYRNCMLVWQLKDVLINDTERKIIYDHMAAFSHRSDDVSLKLMSAYRTKQALLNRPAVRAHWYAAGSDEFRRHLQVYMQAAGMNAHYSSINFFIPHSDYLYNGNLLILSEMQLIAQDLIRGNRAHEPWCYFYLTHLTDYQTALRSVQFPTYIFGNRGVKVNSEPAVYAPLPSELRDPNGIYIGKYKHDNSDVYLPIREMSKHGFITGKSGMGKTTSAMGLLNSFAQKGLPFIVIEPTKTEYRALMNTAQFKHGGLQIFTPGDANTSPISLNIFMPPRGIKLEEYKPYVRELFRMGVSSSQFVASIIPDVLDYCYTSYGWRDSSTISSDGVEIFGMREFICKYREYVRYNIIDVESRSNVENSGILRFQEMLANNAYLFDTDASPDYEKMLSMSTIIELDALGSDYLKCLVTGIFLINLSLVIRKKGAVDGAPRNVLFVDEAHLLLSSSSKLYGEESADPCKYNTELLQKMTQELRAFGLCIFYSDQKPAKLTSGIVGGVNTKLILRLDDQEDINLAATAAHMSNETAEALPSLAVGEGFLHCGNMNEPIRVLLPDVKKALHLSDNVPDEDVCNYMDPTIPPPYSQCSGCSRCDIALRQDASFIARRIGYSKRLRELLQDDKRSKELVALINDDLPEAIRENAGSNDRISEKLVRCVRVHLVRVLMSDGNCKLTAAQLMGYQPLPEPPKPEICWQTDYSDKYMNL